MWIVFHLVQNRSTNVHRSNFYIIHFFYFVYTLSFSPMGNSALMA